VIESVIKMINKLLWRKVETLDLYWFTQPELHSVLLYLLVKDSTNQNLITKQVFNLSFLALQVFLTSLLVPS